jgi:hypothetical protein
MRSYLDLSIRQKLQTIVMVSSTAALLVASVGFSVYDRSTFLRAKTEDLSAAATMIGSNSTAALSFGDAKSAKARVVRSGGCDTPYPRYAFRFVQKEGDWILQ